MKTNKIDTSKPWIPEGFTLEENKPLGEIKWNPKEISLWLHEKQKEGYINGEELNKEVKSPLTSSVLRYLLDHQELIPESWKEKTDGYTTWIYFHGTIFKNSSGNRCVLCVCWHDGKWRWLVGWLDYVFDRGDVSAVLASSSQNSETLNSLDALPLDLTSAIKICKENGLTVTKTY